jgi:L-2-hydroxyglutarate oxidase LhgO
MLRFFFLVLALLLISPAAFGQTTSTDSQTLQALLDEVRQLRKELRTTTVAAQRVQILLYRLQIQEAVVARAEQRVAEAHSTLAQTHSEQKHFASEIKLSEDAQDKTQNPADRKAIEEMLPRLKERLESLNDTEQQLQVKATEAELELKAEQSKRTALQDELDLLDKSLGKL